MKLLFHKYFLAACLVFVGFFSFAQFTVPEKPAVLYPVYDETNTLSQSEKDQLNQKLIKFHDSTSVQIEVVIVPTTNGEDVNFAAWQIGEKWGIRNKDTNNGVVFLIAKDDHKMSIQQGRDNEQYITASVAGQILDYLVTPYFKKGDFYGGIDHGTSAVMDALKGKFKPLAKDDQESQGGLSVFQIIIIALVIFMILRFFFRGGGGNDNDVMLSRRGRSIFPGGFFIFPGSFGGGGFGGGFGGGGGGGFGGFGGGGSGGFGGGGASGGW